MFRSFLRRGLKSPVGWFWVLNALQAARGLLILPLLLRVLPEADLGVYYVFLRIAALVPIVDFGFTGTVSRFVSYATGGATELRAYGIAHMESGATPNKALLWKLLFTYRQLYRLLSVAAFIFVGGYGTYNVALNVGKTHSPSITWAAWGVTLVAAVLEIYAGWWNAFLRAMNEVLVSSRLAVLTSVLQLILAAVLLWRGAGLLAVPLASLVCSLLQRALSRRMCLQILGTPPAKPVGPEFALLKILWPTTWRVGLQFISVYMGTTVPALIYAARLGPAEFAPYGISAQITNFCVGMASVWTQVRWPMVAQYQTRKDDAGLRRILLPSLRRQYATYLLCAVLAVWLAPTLLQFIHSNKQTLPTSWFALLTVTAFLDMRFSFWTMLLSTENRIPSLWPTVATNVLSFALFFLFWSREPGIAALIFAPLAAGALFNYWYWGVAGARSIKATGWFLRWNV